MTEICSHWQYRQTAFALASFSLLWPDSVIQYVRALLLSELAKVYSVNGTNRLTTNLHYQCSCNQCLYRKATKQYLQFLYTEYRLSMKLKFCLVYLLMYLYLSCCFLLTCVQSYHTQYICSLFCYIIHKSEAFTYLCLNLSDFC